MLNVKIHNETKCHTINQGLLAPFCRYRYQQMQVPAGTTFDPNQERVVESVVYFLKNDNYFPKMGDLDKKTPKSAGTAGTKTAFLPKVRVRVDKYKKFTRNGTFGTCGTCTLLFSYFCSDRVKREKCDKMSHHKKEVKS